MRRLRQIWHIWKRIGQAIGDWIARVVLTVFYFTVLPLFGLGVRLLSDPLAIKHKIGFQWLERTAASTPGLGDKWPPAQSSEAIMHTYVHGVSRRSDGEGRNSFRGRR